MLLFANDIVIFTTNEHSLQAQLDGLYEYLQNCGLNINVNKIKMRIITEKKTPRIYV